MSVKFFQPLLSSAFTNALIGPLPRPEMLSDSPLKRICASMLTSPVLEKSSRSIEINSSGVLKLTYARLKMSCTSADFNSRLF